MAESAVSFLLEYLGTLLEEEANLLKGVRGEAYKIRDELENMRSFLKDADARASFLKDADARGHGDENIKTWVKQVREASYDAEDILDEFMLHLPPQRHASCGLFSFLHDMACAIKRLKARHQIATEMHNVSMRISCIAKRKDDYKLRSADQGSIPDELNNHEYYPRLDALFVEESDLVGIDYPKRQLMEWLLGGERNLSSISVVGMGGLGKTALAKKVYDSQQVKGHFHTYAWITASQTFDKTDLLRSMTKQFYKAKQEQYPPEADTMTDVVQLIQMLRDYLRDQRYVFVLDDLWDADAWKFISMALPPGEHGSKVILTTRRSDIASFCCGGRTDCIYNLQPLSDEEAWYLFCKRAFRSNGGGCPPELMELSQSFVNKCRGLPLAIVTLGGLLSMKEKTYAEWEMISRSLGAEIENDDNFKRMTKILMLSYNELPYYLKSCFLYLSIFPEDYLMKRMKLIRLWIAEGFVERQEGRLPEEVAEGYLNMLIARSLIQVVERKLYGKVITCRVHDLLREMIISKSREEHFFASSAEQHATLSKRVRRLSICGRGEEAPKYEKGCSSLRSLFSFGANEPSKAHAMLSFSGFRLLRVLDLENASMESFPEDLTSLFHLRYLSLENAKFQKLPKSLGKLTKLETLNLKGTFVSELPVEILKLQHLRHLLVYHYGKGLYIPFNNVHGTRLPTGVGILRSLQKLAHIKAERDIVRELGNLTQLRRLGVIELGKEDGPDFCTSVAKMSHLQALAVSAVNENEVLDLQFMSYRGPALRRLYLRGRLEKTPDWIASFENLVVLRLRWSRLKDDPLQALQSLPNLAELHLLKAYDGERLSCMAGGCLKLKELRLRDLVGLKEVRLEKGAMPSLEYLSIRRCEELVEVPMWLQHLTNLKELELIDMSRLFVNGLADDTQLADFAGHIPLVHAFDTRSEQAISRN